MTNRFVAAMAFTALVLSVLSLFVALGATDDQVTSPSTEVAPPTTASVAIEAPSTTAARPAANAPDEIAPGTPPPPAEPPSTAAATPATTAPLPGTPSAVGPATGTQLGVVGVSHDDFLNVRDVPNGNVVATLTLSIANSASGEQSILVGSPEATETIATLDVVGVTATGRTRDLRTSTWHEIQAGPVTGWASSNYLAPLSPDTRLDVTAQVLGAIGPTPSAPTMTELAQQVAAEFASDEPPSRIRFTSPTSALKPWPNSLSMWSASPMTQYAAIACGSPLRPPETGSPPSPTATSIPTQAPTRCEALRPHPCATATATSAATATATDAARA